MTKLFFYIHHKNIFIFSFIFLCLLSTCYTQNAYARKTSFGPAILGDATSPKKEDPTKNQNATKKAPDRDIIAPYFFRSDQMGFALGVGGAMTGFQKGQMSLAGTAYGSTDNALAGIFSLNNIELFDSRFFIDILTLDGTFPNQWVYDSEDGSAGKNDSSNTNKYEGQGIDNRIDVTLKYLLPIGDGIGNPIQQYKIDDKGMIASGKSGGTSWNPLKSGLTYIDFVPFYRHMSVDDDNKGKHHYKTLGAKVALRHENTDFPLNPSYGSKEILQYTQGFDAFTHSDSWSLLDFEYAHYFDLGESSTARQRVIALDFWTATTFSGNLPPPWEGAALGGYTRMRGYDDNRFYDNAAIYYSAEYRHTLRWNPLEDWDFVDFDWFQLIGFIEAGRVAQNWDIVELNKDLKYDAGFAIAFFANKYLGRMDFAFSPETWHIRVNISQPF